MTARKHAVAAALAVVAAALTLSACTSSTPTDKTTPTGTVPTSTSVGPTSTSVGPTSTPPTPTATSGPGKGYPVLTPDPKSPALKTYNETLATDALILARKLAYLSVSDTTLLTGTSHTLRDFGSEQLLLTSNANKDLATQFATCNHGAVPTACHDVEALTAYLEGDAHFTVDKPIIPLPQQYTPVTLVTLDSGANGTPPMIVKGSVSSGVRGTYQGKHGALVISRRFSYDIKVTGDPDAPVLVDSWNTYVTTKFIPDK